MHTSHQDSPWYFITRGRGRWLLAAVVLALISLYLASNPHVWSASSAGDTNSPSLWPEAIQAYKTASQGIAASGQALTYTIHVHNGSMTDTSAQVTDPIPPHMNYVAGSANLGAIYDAGTNTVQWTALTITHDSEVNLSFVVTAMAVTTPTSVINTATITADQASFMRSALELEITAQPSAAASGSRIPPAPNRRDRIQPASRDNASDVRPRH